MLRPFLNAVTGYPVVTNDVNNKTANFSDYWISVKIAIIITFVQY